MFEDLRIKIILNKNLTGELYDKYPPVIKEDRRVIEHLIKCSPQDINRISDKIDLTEYVKNNNQLIYYLNDNKLNRVITKLDLLNINISQDIFNKLNDYNKLFVFKINPSKYINYYDQRNKLIVLSNINLVLKNDNGADKKYEGIITEEEFLFIVLNLNEEDFNKLLEWDFYTNEIIEYTKTLKEDELIDFYNKHKKIHNYLDKNEKSIIDIHLAGDDLRLIYRLDEETKIKLLEKKPYYTPIIDQSTLNNYVNSIEFFPIKQMLKNEYTTAPIQLKKLSENELIELSSSNFRYAYDYNYYFSSKESTANNMPMIRKVVQDNINKIEENNQKIKYMKLFDSLSKREIANTSFLYYREDYQISKLLFNEKVVLNNPPELLEEYKNTFKRDILIEILCNAYGQHVREIFEKRPKLNIFDIDNLLIFDKKIYDNLGIGFINFFLSYDMYMYNYIVYEFVNDEQLLYSFMKYFDLIADNTSNLDINIISNAIKKFAMHQDVLRKIDYNNINEELKENILLLINDIPDVTLYVQEEKDLLNYRNLREKKYTEFVETFDRIDDIKNGIMSFILNIDYYDSDSDIAVDKFTFNHIMKAFDIKNIINNEDLIEKINLNKDDISILLLLNEIDNLHNREELVDTFHSIVDNGIDYSVAKNTLNKIKNYCINDVKNNLLSNKKLDNMKTTEVDGVKITNLEGEEFTTLISVIGLNVSSGRNWIELPRPELLIKDWTSREGGSNSISTSLVSSDTSIYPVEEQDINTHLFNKYVVFVFDNDVTIHGMGGSDISSSHTNKLSYHAFNYVLNNKYKFTDMKELKKTINGETSQNDRGKFASEISISRYNEDIKTSTGIERKMPIGIYVVGEVTDYHLKLAKTFNEYYKEHNLGEFRIIRVNPKVYKGKGRIDKLYSKGDEEYGRHI